METVQTHPPSQSSSVAASPLLLRRRQRRRVLGRGGPLPPLRHAAARFLRCPLARRMMLSSPSFLVRENAAEHLEHLACVTVECRERLRGRGRGRERSEEAGEDDFDEEDGGIQTRKEQLRKRSNSCGSSNSEG